MSVHGKRLKRSRMFKEFLEEHEEPSVNMHALRTKMINEMEGLDINDRELQEYMQKSIKKVIMKERGNYYMLMSKETRYFTMFARRRQTTFNDLAQHIKDFLVSEEEHLGGQLKSFQVREDGSFEIWFGNTMYILFHYDRAVEEV